MEEGKGEARLCLLLRDCCLRWMGLVFGIDDAKQEDEMLRIVGQHATVVSHR
jgi:hypothetical protein